MNRQDNRLKLERYLEGALDSAQEYEIRHEDVVIDMPQSGERIRGRDNMKAMQDAYPGPPKVTTMPILWRRQPGGHSGLSRSNRRIVRVRWIQSQGLPLHRMSATSISCTLDRPLSLQAVMERCSSKIHPGRMKTAHPTGSYT
jgi:hypothetical protein